MYNLDYVNAIVFDGKLFPEKLLVDGGYLKGYAPTQCPISGAKYFLKSSSNSGARILNKPLEQNIKSDDGTVECPTCGSP